MPSRSRAFAAAAVMLLAQGLLGMNCASGVTPDCSDAAAQCGPSADAAGDALPSDAGSDTAASDTGAPDAADEG